MEIKRSATAGTLESSDVYIEIEPGNGAIEIDLESVVKQQFGEAIHATVMDVLDEQQVTSAKVHVVDRGALDCVLRARMETAIVRGREES